MILLKSNPPQLSIIAHGMVATTEFTFPHLIPYFYFVPPADGIYDFDFVVTHDLIPGGHDQRLHPIVVHHLMTHVPAGLKGVRIHASLNSKEALLNSPAATKEVNFAGATPGPGGIPIID